MGQLAWDGRRWVFAIQNLKLNCFDELRIVLYTTLGIYVYIHDGVTGLSKNGKAGGTIGLSLRLYAPKGEVDINKALEHVLQKDFGTCLVFMPWPAIMTQV